MKELPSTRLKKKTASTPRDPLQVLKDRAAKYPPTTTAEVRRTMVPPDEENVDRSESFAGRWKTRDGRRVIVQLYDSSTSTWRGWIEPEDKSIPDWTDRDFKFHHWNAATAHHEYDSGLDLIDSDRRFVPSKSDPKRGFLGHDIVHREKEKS